MVRVGDGRIKAGDVIKMASSGKTFDVTEVGVFTPAATPVDELYAGMVGYIAASIKNVKDTAVGDTITLRDNPTKIFTTATKNHADGFCWYLSRRRQQIQRP